MVNFKLNLIKKNVNVVFLFLIIFHNNNHINSDNIIGTYNFSESALISIITIILIDADL